MRAVNDFFHNISVFIICVLYILAALFFLIYPYIWAIIKEWGYIKTLDVLHASLFVLVIIFLLPLADMVYISYLSEDFDCNGPGCVVRFTLLAYFYSDIIRWGASTGIFRIGTPDTLFYLPPVLASMVFVVSICFTLHNFRDSYEDEFWQASLLAALLSLLIRNDYMAELSLIRTAILCIIAFAVVFLLCVGIREIEDWADNLSKKAECYADSQQSNNQYDSTSHQEEQFDNYSHNDSRYEQQYTYNYRKSYGYQKAKEANRPNIKVYFPNISSKAEARSLYRKHCKILHPDNPVTGNEERFKEMAEEFKNLA